MLPAPPPFDATPSPSTRSAARILAGLAGLAGLASLAGLATGHAWLIRAATREGLAAAAAGIVAAAVALWACAWSRARPRYVWVARVLAGALMAGSVAYFAAQTAAQSSMPGPFPSLSLDFLLYGTTLMLATVRAPGRRTWFQLPLLPILWNAFLSIMARFFGVHVVNTHFDYLLIPAPTAIWLGALSAGGFLLHPREGIAGVMTSRNSGSVLARIAIPITLLLPFTVGWVRIQSLRTGQYDLGGAFAQFSTSNIFLFCGLILFSAHILNRLDTRRQETLKSLRAANAELEARIHEQRRAEAAREESERQLFQAQKMEAMGVLASGIAHDFNNILTVILLNAEEAEADAGSRQGLKRNIGEIRKFGERAAGLIRQIMAFGRNEPGTRHVVQLSAVIADTAEILRPVLPAGITLKTEIAPYLPQVLADAGQLRQVLLNLANNAAHAMEGRAGLLEIRAQSCPRDFPLPAGLEPGRYALVIVRDTGRGMDVETAKRIFDPFFTTKPPGKGTGLGLSVVHGIMRLHGGAVTVRSEPERGTEFRLYLPAETENPKPEG